MARYSSLNHPVIASIAWEPVKAGERINDHVLMARGTSNAYVVTSDDGDVVINTGTPYQGARNRERFEQLLGRPLQVKKIVFTQHHPDHIGGWSVFADEGVQTLVHREFPRLWAERKMLARFFEPRSARVLKAMIPRKEHIDAWYKGTRDPEPLTLTGDHHAFLLGGRRYELLSAPSGETLDALLVWMPGERTLFTGNWLGAIQGALPNFYTARGDRDRSVTRFFEDMDTVLSLRPEVLITGHDEPIVGAETVSAYLRKIRDAVRYIHDETVKGMNAHQDLWTLMREIRLPQSLEPKPGRAPVAWYVRTVWEEYTGWFRSESTTELYPVPVNTIYAELSKLAGGPEVLLQAAKRHLAEGRPIEALHFVEIALSAARGLRAAREVEIAILEQLIEANGGRSFDELGWLEHAVAEANAAMAQGK